MVTVWAVVMIAALVPSAGGGVAHAAGPSGVARREPLVARCLVMSGAGHPICRRAPDAPPPTLATPPGVAAPARAFSPALALSPASTPVLSPAPAPPAARFGFADFGGAYALYRLVSATNDYRRCRLQPTCSLFAAQAARRFGLLRGLLMGLARAQMSHSDQGGLLPRELASDGQFIFLDPVERWLHPEPGGRP
jgi:hypothetical protein